MARQRRTEEQEFAQEYLIHAPDESELGPYEDGFSSRTVIGALFVAVVMMPGSIYLGLVAGQSLGPAAEWVTIILFAEVARRSFAHLKRQEVFILFYVASGIAAVALMHLALAGGPFTHAIWNQYLRRSPQTSTIAADIPDWVVPAADSPALQDRNLMHKDWWWSASRGWLSPVVLIGVGTILGRLTYFGLGYLLFRILSDKERLPFPLAPVAAAGATALAESTDRDDGGESKRQTSWRWNVFSLGASLGTAFGCLYILLPVVTDLFLAKPIMLFPIPFVDFTQNVESVLPASLISISFNMGLFLVGMILPFRLVLGGFLAILCTSVFGNPLLLKLGAFPHYKPGRGLLVNELVLRLDFWLSVQIGLALAVAAIGVWSMLRRFSRERAERESRGAPPPDEQSTRRPSRERGDFPIWVAACLFLVGTGGFAWICHVLVPEFPVWIILVFGFLWSPFHSYISGRLVGLTGHGVATPYLKETAFILSGYEKVDIWFAPIPLFDHGHGAQRFRELELTRTKFTSIIKAEFLMLPIIFVSSFVFWWLFWKLNEIPSTSFPFAARIWPLAARQANLIFTANQSENPLLLQALKPWVIGGAAGIGLSFYAGLSWLGMPVVFFYGIIGGAGAPLHAGLSTFVGALFGRYLFLRKFGRERWARYLPVVAAGFSCGMGLAGMTAVAFSLISQCTRELPF